MKLIIKTILEPVQSVEESDKVDGKPVEELPIEELVNMNVEIGIEMSKFIILDDH